MKCYKCTMYARVSYAYGIRIQYLMCSLYCILNIVYVHYTRTLYYLYNVHMNYRYDVWKL